MTAIRYSRGDRRNEAAGAYPDNLTARDFAAFEVAVLGDRAPRKGTLYIAAPFKVNGNGRPHRCKEEAEPRAWLPFDLDGMRDGEAWNDLALWLQQFRGFAYTTARHAPDMPRVRIVLEASRPVDRTEGQRVCLALEGDMKGALGPDLAKFDGTVYRGEQPCFTPLVGAQTFRFEGAPVDVDELLERAPEIREAPGASDRAKAAAERDPILRELVARRMVKRELQAGHFAVICPCAAEHTSESNDTSTVYMLPNFGGVKYGKFRCLHAHCSDREQEAFIEALGLEPKDVWREQRGDDAAFSWGDAQDAPREIPEPQNLFDAMTPTGLDLRAALPAVLADFAMVRATVAGHDPTAYAYAAIGAASGVIPHRTRIELAANWREPLLQWVAEVGPTGSGKSPAMNAAVEPVVALHLEREATHKREFATWKGAKCEGDPPARSGYYFTDPTIDALIDRAANASHTILRHADEGTSWLNHMGRFSTKGDGGERGTWLAGWNGAAYTVTRIERGDKSLDSWAVAVLYGITPAKLREAYADAASDGMLARTLICLTDAARWVPAQPDPNAAAVTEHYARAVQAAAKAERTLTLSATAAARWQALRTDYRATAQAVAELSPGLSGFLVKAPTIAARLAGLFALIEGAATVSDGSMERAERFMRHATMTARIAHEQVFAVSQPVAIARRLAARILTSGTPRITRREFMRTDAFAKATEPERGAAIDHLAGAGWLLETDGKRVRLGPRFREATAWRVNGLVYERFAEIAEQERNAAQDALARLNRLCGTTA